MKVELDLSPKKIIGLSVFSIVLLLFGLFIGGEFGYNDAKNTQFMGQDCLTEINLGEQDLNYIRDTSFYLNGCEKLGLQSDLMIQQDQNGNAYGIPICVEAKKQ